MQLEEDIGRRELLRTALRGLALASLGGIGLGLALRQGRDDCPPRAVCETCRLRTGCRRAPDDSEEDGMQEGRHDER